MSQVEVELEVHSKVEVHVELEVHSKVEVGSESAFKGDYTRTGVDCRSK